MRQAIAYSLYGNEMRFLVGAIKNAELAQRFFPDHEVQIYYGKSVPMWVLSTLNLFPNVELYKVSETEDSISRSWRFMACIDPDNDVVMVRDVDARLSLREAEAHQEFLDSKFNFHIIRDHPTGHNYNISAGMFAIKTDAYRSLFHRSLLEHEFSDYYTTDQDFLNGSIYPNVLNDCLIHDEYTNIATYGDSQKGHIKRKKIATLSHIGAALDENDVFYYQQDRELSLQETGTVTYMYDWNDGK